MAQDVTALFRDASELSERDPPRSSRSPGRSRRLLRPFYAQKAMRPAQHFLAVVLAVTVQAACGQPKGFDQMKLYIGLHGPSLLSDIVKPPANVGDITWWRTTFPGQVFAAVKTEQPCPRDIHAIVGVEFRKERIELCYTATPRDEPVPGFPCSPEVYLRYEILGMPADVEPKFAYVGACALATPATSR